MLPPTSLFFLEQLGKVEQVHPAPKLLLEDLLKRVGFALRLLDLLRRVSSGSDGFTRRVRLAPQSELRLKLAL